MRTLPLPLAAAPLILVPYLLLVPPILAVRTWVDPATTSASCADVAGSDDLGEAGWTQPLHRVLKRRSDQSRLTYGIRAI